MSRVVIVGGGVMGAAVACFLARDFGVRATVLERDPTYARASSALSASSIRQQFSQPVNIALSRASLGFLRRIGDELAVAGTRPDIGLVEPGYLYLASDAGARDLRALHALQRAEGVDVQLLDPAALRARWPWLATDDIALGSWGASGEGWFDGWSVLQAFRRAAIHHGARFETAEVSRIDAPRAHCRDGRVVEADTIVLAAGAWSARLGVALPVVASKRDVFVVDTPAALPGCPLLIDPSGIWLRPEGRGFICGAPPRAATATTDDTRVDEADEAPLEAIDHALFDDVIWPTLAARVPALQALRVTGAWAGYYEMNTFDHNGLAGELAPGLWTACGFSGHGMQQAPAVGQALAAAIAGRAEAAWVDIAPLSPQRLVRGAPLLERNVI
jgi:FAD-dependent oxidoreductase domain-containing protein 1